MRGPESGGRKRGIRRRGAETEKETKKRDCEQTERARKKMKI